MSLYFQQLTSPQIEEAAKQDTLIILPVGQIEEHGPHLPLNCDCIIAEQTSRVVAEKICHEIPVLLMPTIWTAYSVKQVSRWPGLITFREPETMIQMIYDILESLVKNGFRKS
jgi:creatinine amidohydrolase